MTLHLQYQAVDFVIKDVGHFATDSNKVTDTQRQRTATTEPNTVIELDH